MKVTGWSAQMYSAFRWSTKLLALMECAARSSYLVMQPWEAFPVCRFRQRRVRQWCHLQASHAAALKGEAVKTLEAKAPEMAGDKLRGLIPYLDGLTFGFVRFDRIPRDM